MDLGNEMKYLQGLQPVSQYKDKNALAKEILLLVAMGGFAASCLVTPGLAYAAKLFPNITGQENSRLKRQIRSLVRRGLIQEINSKYYLTPEGVLYKNKLIIETFSLPIWDKEQWEGKWHVILFDIPETHRNARNSFRRILQRHNYFEYQKSVYVHPHDYSKEFKKLAKLHDVVAHVNSFSAMALDREPELKNYYNLTFSKHNN